MQRLTKKTSGFTLLEIVMALMIISVGLVGSSRLFFVALNGVYMNKIKSQSYQLAKDLIEEILSREWEDPVLGSPGLNFDPGETRCGNTVATVFDDIDDYHDLGIDRSVNPPVHFFPPEALNPDNAAAGCVPMDGRTITVDGTDIAMPDYRHFSRFVAVGYVKYYRPDPIGAPDEWEEEEVVAPSTSAYKQIVVTVLYSAIDDFVNHTYSFELRQTVGSL